MTNSETIPNVDARNVYFFDKSTNVKSKFKVSKKLLKWSPDYLCNGQTDAIVALDKCRKQYRAGNICFIDWNFKFGKFTGVKTWQFITINVTDLKNIVISANGVDVERKINMKKSDILYQAIKLLKESKKETTTNYKYSRSLIYDICKCFKNELKFLNVNFDNLLTSVKVIFKNKVKSDVIYLEELK